MVETNSTGNICSLFTMLIRITTCLSLSSARSTALKFMAEQEKSVTVPYGQEVSSMLTTQITTTSWTLTNSQLFTPCSALAQRLLKNSGLSTTQIRMDSSASRSTLQWSVTKSNVPTHLQHYSWSKILMTMVLSMSTNSLTSTTTTARTMINPLKTSSLSTIWTMITNSH